MEVFKRLLRNHVEEVNLKAGTKVPVTNKEGNVTGAHPYPYNKPDDSPLFQQLVDASQFIVELRDEDDVNLDYDEKPNSVDRFGLPFPICFFQPSTMKPFYKLNIDTKSSLAVEIYGVLVKEWTPDLVEVRAFGKVVDGVREKDYECKFNYSFHYDDYSMCTDSVNVDTKVVEVSIAPYIMQIVQSILTTLQTSKVGVVRKTHKIKYRFKKKNYQHKINKVVYTGSREIKETKNIFGASHTVDWSHGWTVRGHWRRLPMGKTGKDRSGEYTVSGATWVVPHSKKDELGIVDKVRKFHMEEEV